MAKAYGPDEQAERGIAPIPDSGFVETASNDRAFLSIEALKQPGSFTEVLSVLGVAYICCVTSFNAGYFSKIPNSFVEFFSLTDMLGASVPIIQYFLLVYSVYGVLYLALAWVAIPIWAKNRTRAYNLAKRMYENFRFGLSVFFLVIASMSTLFLFLGYIQTDIFSFEFLPLAAVQWAGLYLCWVGYNERFIARGSFIITVLISVIMFSYVTGKTWLEYELRSAPKTSQAILTNSVGCIDRKILRSSSTGYLLYNFSIKQFEFRDRSDVRAIYQEAKCT